MELTPQESKFYDRHIRMSEIGKDGQLKLKSARVLVVGAGGLGVPILQYLAAAGVGIIGIVDGDTIDVSNLQRQVLYAQSEVGKPKASTAAQKLRALNPHIQINVHPEYLNKGNILSIFEPYDIIVDGTDNFPTRYLVNDACVLSNKTLVFGSIFKFDGQVAVFNYNGGPTYRCLYPEPPLPHEVPSCSEVGVLGVLPGIVGSLMANEVLKIVLEIGDVLSGKLLNFDALTLQQYILGVAKSAAPITQFSENYEFFCGIHEPDEALDYTDYLEDENRFLLLDVREPHEHAAQNIGGMNIPLSELADRYNEIPQNKALLVYCSSGKRSLKAISVLKSKNFPKPVFDLEGGMP